MTTPARARYAGYRFAAEIIGHAVWLYFRFPLGLRMWTSCWAARGIIISHETVRQWAQLWPGFRHPDPSPRLAINEWLDRDYSRHRA
jgi:transposase-like protein